MEGDEHEQFESEIESGFVYSNKSSRFGRKKLLIALLVAFIIFNLVLLSTLFSVGIGVGVLVSDPPPSPLVDFSGITFYSTYYQYFGAPYVYHKPSDYQIDRKLSFEQNFLETNEYKISVDISRFNSRKKGIEEMKRSLLAAFPFEFTDEDIEESIYEEKEYKIKNCNVTYESFKLKKFITGSEAKSSEVNLRYDSTPFDNKKNAVKTDLTPALQYYSRSETKIEQTIHPCSYHYSKKSKIKKLDENFEINKCGDAAELFPTSAFAHSNYFDNLSQKDSSPSYFYEYKIKSFFQYDITKYTVSWRFEYDTLDDAQSGSVPPKDVDFAIKTYSPRKGKDTWDYQLLTRAGKMYQTLIQSYGSSDYPCF